MKTKFFIILALLFTYLIKAQFTFIPMPEGFGYFDGGEFRAGGSQIIYQQGNYVYGITHKNTGKGFIYRYDDTTTQIKILGGKELGDNGIPNNFVNYNDRLYFNYTGNIYSIDLNTDMIEEILQGSSNFYIKGDKLYSFDGVNLSGQYGSASFKIYDMMTRSLTVPVYTDPVLNLDYFYYFTSFKTSGENTYFHGYNFRVNDNFKKFRLFKLDKFDQITIVHDFQNELIGENSPQIFEDSFRPMIPFVNQKLILGKSNYKIATFDTETQVYNDNASDLPFKSQENSFTANGWLYFKDNYDNVYKTDGLNFIFANLNPFFSSGSGEDLAPVVLYKNNYYGTYNPNYSSHRIFKTDLTLGNSSVVATKRMRDGKVIGDRLFFFEGSPNLLTSYDEVQFRSLDLNFIPRYFCNKIMNIGKNVFTSGYKSTGGYGSMYDYGLYKIDASTLSANEIENVKSSSIIYPNPAKNFIVVQNKNKKAESFNYKFFDLSGRLIQNGQAKFNDKIEVSDIGKGNYILQILSKTGSEELKLIKN